jgi:hypothetical protein
MVKGKRNKKHSFPANIPPLVPERYFGRQTSHRESADDFKRCLLDEAQFLTGVGNPLGKELHELTLRLPVASLERLAR